MIETSFRSIATGVGIAPVPVIGVMRHVEIKIGNLLLSPHIRVIEHHRYFIIIGLDLLRKHQACIDLKKNVLIIGDEEVPFLDKADIPNEAYRPQE